MPRSTIPGEAASPTQPFTAVTPPLSPHSLLTADAWGINDAEREECRAQIAGLKNEGIFTPPSLEGTLVYPSNIGGAHWGGVAYDPGRRIAVVPVNRHASMVQLIPKKGFDRKKAEAESDRLNRNYEYNIMFGTPYAMRRRALVSSSGLPCTPPPFGALVAIDLDSGKKVWEVPLGSYPRARGHEAATVAEPAAGWGSPNLGGPVATKSGLIFIAAAFDQALRAFDTETGQELWKTDLPADGRATPSVYAGRDGRQYVVIAITGGGVFGEGDFLMAFALE